ncbi:MAG: DNA polymerase III subunit gamma/tau [Clostridiales bacterium]|nr:DNA polymerase III subunit gamma/tau [Clostridiales bacterium]
MAYLAFYRTFRPTTFDSVVRQEHIVKILTNQIETGKIGHAYLFCGPRGTGKTTLAKIFAKAINCENPQNGSPCGKCATCRALASGAALDISEIDAASNNGVDEMRDIREKVQYPPVNGKYKVYIIDEVHMLTQSAFNAVLKTLEEPPAHAVFILATTEPQKIPATILSRCMRFDFKLIPQSDLEKLVKSVYDKTGKEYEDEAVAAIARAGNGSARDSLSIADMCASYSQGKLTYDDVNKVLGKADFFAVAEIIAAVLSQNGGETLTATESVLATGKGVGVLLRDMLSFLNNLAVVKMCGNAAEIVNLPKDKYEKLKELAAEADGHTVLRATEILAKTEGDLRYAVDGRITLEAALIRAAMPSADYDIEALLSRIEKLEREVAEGVKVKIESRPAPTPAPEAPAPKPDYGSKRPPVEALPAADETPTRPAKSAVVEEEGFSPFDEPAPFNAAKATEEQSTLFEQPAASAPIKVGSLSDKDKATMFGRFIKLFRTTRRNAVLFTLCMDLESEFEGDTFVLLTTVEAVYRSLNREDNRQFIAEALQSLGVFSFDIRLKPKGEDKYEKAIGELRDNFKGTDVQIK